MSNIKRQHLISISFVAVMLMWIGVAGAAWCPLEQKGISFMPAKPQRQAAVIDFMERDEHYDDRYLNWGGAAKRMSPPHLSVRRNGGEPK